VAGKRRYRKSARSDARYSAAAAAGDPHTAGFGQAACAFFFGLRQTAYRSAPLLIRVGPTGILGNMRSRLRVISVTSA